MARAQRSRRGEPVDLWILGLGIRGLSQVTVETLDVLRRCRRILHLTQQHEELAAINPRLVDLEEAYWTGEERPVVYERLVELVLAEVARGPEVALVSYGHPMIFDDVTLELVRRSRRDGFTCRVLPAVSCLDTLCIDLGIDYGRGLQVFEASSLVADDQPMSPQLDTLVLQLGEFGTDRTADTLDGSRGRLRPLVRHLLRFYAPGHRAVIAFSDDGDFAEPQLLGTRVGRLAAHAGRIFPGVTLYLPPGPSPRRLRRGRGRGSGRSRARS
jgi:precorrin-6B methylase 1